MTILRSYSKSLTSLPSVLPSARIYFLLRRLCGFSTCERLIRELSGLSLPSTAAKPTFPWFPEFSLGTNSNVTVASPFNPAGTYPAVDALTLIVACRRKSKAEETRSKLLQDFEKQLSVRDGRSSRNARTGSLTQHPYSFTATFARRLMVDAVEFDTTLNCSKNVSALNEYVNDRWVPKKGITKCF